MNTVVHYYRFISFQMFHSYYFCTCSNLFRTISDFYHLFGIRLDLQMYRSLHVPLPLFLPLRNLFLMIVEDPENEKSCFFKPKNTPKNTPTMCFSLPNNRTPLITWFFFAKFCRYAKVGPCKQVSAAAAPLSLPRLYSMPLNLTI